MFGSLRALYQSALTPLAKVLLRVGLSPSGVTVLGTAGVLASALWFIPRGHLVTGSLVVLVFLLGDGLDGTMARLSGRTTRFGAFLDSTLDRLADAAVFVAIAWWCLRVGDTTAAGLSAAVLVLGFLVSYARARAEVEGWDASVGIFERSDRLVVALVGLLAVGAGAPGVVLTVALGVVAVGSAVTVAQRVAAAHHASREDDWDKMSGGGAGPAHQPHRDL